MADAKQGKNNINQNVYSNSMFFCFSIDKKLLNPEYFIIENNNILKSECLNYDNFTVLRVFLETGLLTKFKSFFSTNTFKISYKIKEENITIYQNQKEFEIIKEKVQFIYNAGKNGILPKYQNYFKNPSCLEQYLSFKNLTNNEDYLNENTINYLNNKLDLELFLYLLGNNDIIKTKLLTIFEKFPSIKIVYDKNKLFNYINIDSLQIDKGISKKLKLIYSIIQDSPDIIKNFHEEDINNIYEYNMLQKDKKYKIPIKKNIFEFLVKKLKNEDNIKLLCKNCESIDSLTDYLELFKNEKIHNLTSKDMPQIFSLTNNFKEIIVKLEKLKDLFCENEIFNIWKNILDSFSEKNIEELEDLLEKFKLANEKLYEKVIELLALEISKKGRQLIKDKKLVGLKMYNFCKKYNNIGDFFADEQLLESIAQNIILKELNNKNILEEYNECKFLIKIKEERLDKFITGILNQINSFEDFSLFFKFIYKLKSKEEELENKDLIIAKKSINRFISLLNNFKINYDINKNKELLKNIFLLSLMYIPKKNSNDYNNIIKVLIDNYTSRELIKFFIVEFINYDTEKYISNDLKDLVSLEIINIFFKKLNIEERINNFLEIKSLKFKEEYIYSKFPKICFEDLLSKENKDSFEYLFQFIKKGILNNDEIQNSIYFKELKSECYAIIKKLENKEINFSDI